MWSWTLLVRPIRKAWSDFRNPSVPKWIKLIPVLAIVYALSPIDVIPDVFVGLGQLDDVGIILLALKLFTSLSQPRIKAGKENKYKDEKFTSGQTIEEGEFEEM